MCLPTLKQVRANNIFFKETARQFYSRLICDIFVIVFYCEKMSEKSSREVGS